MQSLRYIPLILLLLLAACSGNQDKPDAWGTFEATEITVSAMANGKLLQFTIEEGMLVDSGQQVGFVDTTDLWLKKQQAIKQREATASRRTDLQSQIEVQEQNRANLQIDQQRIEKLLAAGAATQKQMDDVNAGLNLIDKQIASIQTQFGGLNDQIGSIQEQIAQVEEAIRNAYIINPVKGTVLTKFAERDEVVAFGKPLYKIANLDAMILRVYITGAQLSDIAIGQTVEVLFDKTEKENHKMTGVVSWISPTAEFTPKTIQTKKERVNLVYAVKIRVSNDEGLMKIGMPGEIRFVPANKP
jgi:HlyD family secretion protein